MDSVAINRRVPAEELEALVGRLARDVPFWSGRLAPPTPAFADLPLLTRADVRGHSPYDFVPQQMLGGYLLYCESTGTTGEPLSSFHRMEDIVGIGSEVRLPTALTKLLQPGVPVANALPYEMGFVGQATSMLLRAARAVEIPVSTRTTVCPPERAVAIIRKLRPRGLLCLPVDAECYAQILADEGVDPASLGIEVIMVSSEPSSPARRAHLERLYGAQVVNFFGASELGAVAIPCDHGRAHFREGSLYGELLVPDGSAAAGGAREPVTGELVITTLAPRAMPVLRYAIRDVVTVAWDPCPCGQSSPTLDYRCRAGGQIRVGDRTWTPIDLEDLVYQVEAGPWYRIEVHPGPRVLIQVETRAGAADDVGRTLAGTAAERLGVPVDVETFRPGELYDYRGIRGRKPMSRIVEHDGGGDITWAS
ncbi:hypothetical protein AQ490_12210 [Wenjunlia vitaminophila]|uniref:Phenylacetate-CoA ligase n=1 Tax=Wenjunlia vitaminophila TaxID=76728 RepID=A0A0T6LKZ3_WENVI|nr:phenylacetate--CoA ligase family protein [Wenjunlia vitaminophila]KRV46628.1 hypothetical protein AQ490_12210 [Wenjunlia vitaminophila]